MNPSPPKRSALFIALEGIDGSGTTTQLDRVVADLGRRGRAAMATREPSGGPVGRLLREILLGQHGNTAGKPVDGRTMALLFAADRRDHLSREVEPTLDSGTDVVTDRYLMSSLAYQSVEADRSWVESLADGIRMPDLTLLLDLPIPVAAERRRLAGRAIERYDADSTLERVAENYRRLARDSRQGHRVTVIDASPPVADVERAIANEITALIDSRELGS